MASAPGKRVGENVYLHVEALSHLDSGDLGRVRSAGTLAGVEPGTHYNLVRMHADGFTVALLNYPHFFDDPFPALRERWLVDLDKRSASYRTYADSLNPPILHRKELLLPGGDVRRERFAELTAAAEAIGLFDAPKRIGYRRQWEQLIRDKGYRLDGHRLVPLGNADAEGEVSDADTGPLHGHWEAARQRTALVRYGFSAPVQTLARHGFLDGRYRLFDYGCGRGGDVRGLRENGLTATGWDPYYAPEQPIESADVVNLGFVINVIEGFDERLEALTRAWSLAETLLVVSVMLANQNDPRGQCFRDGVMTQRGTFQKYYSQQEIKTFLEQALDEEPIAVAPGVLYVFRDKDAEQRFLVDRYRSRRNGLRQPSLRGPVLGQSPERVPRMRRDRAAERYGTYREPLDRLWDLWVGLGRRPDPSEVPDLLSLAEGFGSLPKALRFIEGRHDRQELDAAQAGRIADLSVYLALNQFERRRAYRHLEPGLQRDIKAFFGDYGAAQSEARELLFRISDTEAIADACRTASEHGLGWLEPGASLQLHSSLIEQLPPLLRVYIGCAAVLYGDLRNADLVKVHIGSGKVSLMRYDDFEGQALPRMVERVKIKLREQDVDYFAYGEGTEYPPPYLFRKSRFVNEEFPGYPEQLVFEEDLDALGLFDLSGYGPDPDTFDRALTRHRWQVEGLRLKRPSTRPALDDPCGRFLRFRQLIECGETQACTGLPNLPHEPESWNALQDLAEQVLDPVIDWFGLIRLTYGFCSPELAREIPGRIDPKLDQHAAYEVNRRGKAVCERLGAAVDFIVDDEDMLEVARWVVINTPFDRLYFYGPDLPIHVSYSREPTRQVVRMMAGKSGRLIPRVTSSELFLKQP